MVTLESLAGIDETEPEYRLALDLARADRAFLRALVQQRRERMTQQDVADRLGITQPTVAAFERHDSDPKLSTIRRYAQVVGVMVEHSVSQPRWLDATVRARLTASHRTATAVVVPADDQYRSLNRMDFALAGPR